jgi:hypothetical protein
MKFCQSHWEKLKKKIDDLGLSGLIAKGGEEAVNRQFDQLKKAQQGAKDDDEAVTKSNFDPLMGAHWAIVSNAMNLVGLNLMAPNDDGSERCPLCYIQQEHDAHCTVPDCKTSYDEWIDYAGNDMLAEAKRLGLVGGA